MITLRTGLNRIPAMRSTSLMHLPVVPLLRCLIFALNITPYITSSIIMQLLTIAIPKLEEMQRDGEEGRKKITAITRYVTVGLALFESICHGNRIRHVRVLFRRYELLRRILQLLLRLTAGSALLMWIGERITEKGVGNGISIVLTVNIVSRVPSDLTILYENFIKGKTIAKGMLAGLIIAAIIIAMVVFVLILNGAERRIPVQYSKKMVGRKLMGGQTTNIPLKVNTAGVIPVIFASSIMSFPVVIAQLAGKQMYRYWRRDPSMVFLPNNWCNPSQPISISVGLVVYIVLLCILCIFLYFHYL